MKRFETSYVDIKNMAFDYNIPVAIFSLEMSGKALNNRLLSNLANVDGNTIKGRKFTPEQWESLHNAAALIEAAPIKMTVKRGMTIQELRAKAYRLVRNEGVKVIMIDYLQLITDPETDKKGIREQTVTNVTKALKTMAEDLEVPVIALAQLNRNLESRQDKRPVTSDLRESGGIELEADIICLLHNPEAYAKQSGYDFGIGNKGKIEMIIAKNRSGSVGDIDLRFDKEFTRFEDWETSFVEGPAKPK